MVSHSLKNMLCTHYSTLLVHSEEGRKSNSMTDIDFMKQAVACARQCQPVETAYNVGAVLVNAEGCVVSTGFSRELEGNTHAEQCALMKAVDTNLEGATIFTTMEPCSHRNSGNTPCVQRILQTKIRRVVIGALEPKVFVENCQGVHILREAGFLVEILDGLQEECLAPNRHLLGE